MAITESCSQPYARSSIPCPDVHIVAATFRQASISVADLTQATVAERLSKPQSYVAKYERGERRLDVVEFVEVAEAIRFDAAEFIRALAKNGRGR